MNTTTLWSLWLDLPLAFRTVFTAPGHRHFVTWTTGLVLPTPHRSLVQTAHAAGQDDSWRNLHAFANSALDRSALRDCLTQRLAVLPAPRRLFHGYHVSAGDDTKVHRNSPGVWGVRTFHNYSARYPNRAATVRAHHWVVLGSL